MKGNCKGTVIKLHSVSLTCLNYSGQLLCKEQLTFKPAFILCACRFFYFMRRLFYAYGICTTCADYFMRMAFVQ